MSWTPENTYIDLYDTNLKVGDKISLTELDITQITTKNSITMEDTSHNERIINTYELLTMLLNQFSLPTKFKGLYSITPQVLSGCKGPLSLNVNLWIPLNPEGSVYSAASGNNPAQLRFTGGYNHYYGYFYPTSSSKPFDHGSSTDDFYTYKSSSIKCSTVAPYTDAQIAQLQYGQSLASADLYLISCVTSSVSPGQPDDGDGKNSTEPNHGGDGDNTSDNTTILTPAFNGAGHFNRMYAISETQVKNVRNFLWNGSLFDITTFQKLFSNPMEAVIGLRYFPFDLQTHDASGLGASESMRIGNIDIGLSGLPVLSTYNQIFDLGTFDLNEYFGTAMDYEPYQKLAIYLPYIGIKPININNFMGSAIGIKYIVDIMTGECIATLWRNDQLLEHYEGKIGINISVSASNDAQYNAGLLMSVVSGGVAIAGALTANPMIATGGILSAAKSVASNQHHYTSGGLNSPNSSLYMPQYPYLIIQRPVQSLSSNFQLEEGYPLNAKETLSDLSGMTVCSNPILTGLTCTDEEKSEVYSILTSGVIL